VDLIRSAETMRIDRSGAGEALPAPGSCERCGYITSQARGAPRPELQRACCWGVRVSPTCQALVLNYTCNCCSPRRCFPSLGSVCRVAASAAAESHATPVRSSPLICEECTAEGVQMQNQHRSSEGWRLRAGRVQGVRAAGGPEPRPPAAGGRARAPARRARGRGAVRAVARRAGRARAVGRGKWRCRSGR